MDAIQVFPVAESHIHYRGQPGRQPGKAEARRSRNLCEKQRNYYEARTGNAAMEPAQLNLATSVARFFGSFFCWDPRAPDPEHSPLFRAV